MKKILFFLSLLGVMEAFSAAMDGSYLYWMVDDVTADGRTIEYDTVKIKVSGTGSAGTVESYLTIGLNENGSWSSYSDNQLAGVSAATMKGLSDNGFGGFYADLGSYAATGYGYVIELYKDQGLQSFSETLSYDSAAQYIANFSGGVIDPMGLAKAWSGGTHHVPEPSSALLLMLGLAGLALRRRQMKA